MAATATEKKPAPANSVKITDAGPSRKKISIEVPAAAVKSKLTEAFDTLEGEAELPGFRKGRVPRQLIEKRFGTHVRGETKSQIVSDAYRQVMEEHKLQVVGEPFSETLANTELKDGQTFAFELEVEVMPQFELPSLDGIKVIRPTLDVTDEMVQKEISNLCINEGDLETREKAEAGDYATGHATMVDDKGTEFYNIKGAVVQKPAADKGGKGMILGVMVDDFDKQMGNPKPGDTITVKCKGPENHEVEGLRNANLTVTFKVERIDRIVPASVDKIVSGFGMQDEQQLKDALKQRLDQRVQQQQQSAMRQQIAKHLGDQVKMDLPERLSARESVRTLERRRWELMNRGVEQTKIEEHMAELRASSAAFAKNDLKLFFILTKAAESLGIEVNDQEINNHIYQMAMMRNVRPEKLRQDIIQANQVGAIYAQIRDHKTMDAILAKADVSEMAAEEFNKKMAATDKVG